jgi:hypothetical protein
MQRADLSVPEQEFLQCPKCNDSNKNSRLLGVIIVFSFAIQSGYAQTESLPFQNGEELSYDIHYKYGLVMLKAGVGRYSIEEIAYEEQPAYKSALYFKTSFFFDKIFKIRDTLNSYASIPTLVPIYHNRNINEGNTHFKEDLFFLKHSISRSEVRSKQERNTKLRFDTVLNVNNLGYDILSIFMFIRTLDYSKIKPGDSFQITIFMGKKTINVIIRYKGQAIIGKRKAKYKTLNLNVDITDKVFSESKNSMEIWLSDDENKIPLKIKAKLKIGSAEANLSSYKNLKNPFPPEAVMYKPK